MFGKIQFLPFWCPQDTGCAPSTYNIRIELSKWHSVLPVLCGTASRISVTKNLLVILRADIRVRKNENWRRNDTNFQCRDYMKSCTWTTGIYKEHADGNNFEIFRNITQHAIVYSYTLFVSTMRHQQNFYIKKTKTDFVPPCQQEKRSRLEFGPCPWSNEEYFDSSISSKNKFAYSLV